MSATAAEILHGLVGQEIKACSTTTDDDDLLGFHILGEDGYAVTVKGRDLTVETYKGWVIPSRAGCVKEQP